MGVPIGTPISELIAFCGGYTEDAMRLIGGGSMMGYALPHDDLPIGKASNCVIAAAAIEVRTDASEWPCIRCGDCADACPPRLQPQELLVAAHAQDFVAFDALGLDDCIECGCCDVACPSHIPLTQTFREQRLETERQRDRDLQGELQRSVDDPASRSKAIQAALDRVRQNRGHGRA